MAKKKSQSAKILFIIIGTLLVGFVIGFYFQSKTMSKDVSDYKNRIDQREADIDLILEGRARIADSNETEYTFADFGLYSPLFEGKKLINTTYWYRDSNIINSVIELTENIQAEVWLFEEDKSSSNQLGRNYAIFSGYENYSLLPTLVSDLISDSSEKFVNTKGLEFFWMYSMGPKGEIYAVSANYYSKYSPLGGPAFYQFTKGGFGTVENLNKNSTVVIQAKRDLQDVINQVNYQNKN